MRIAILSDTVHPTPMEGGHGLGRACYNVAMALLGRGHDVTLFGLDGSSLHGGRVVTTALEFERGERALAALLSGMAGHFDVALDAGHTHTSARAQIVPTLAYFQDMSSLPAPNAVFVSKYCRQMVKLPGPVVRNAVVPDGFPLYTGEREGAVFLGNYIWHKGADAAERAAKLAGIDIRIHGQGLKDGPITGVEKIEALQKSICMLAPYHIDAGPLAVLEAMACGTPVIGYHKCALVEYIGAGVSGFLGNSIEEMAAFIPRAGELEPEMVRAWVIDNGFTIERQAAEIEELLLALVSGERW